MKKKETKHRYNIEKILSTDSQWNIIMGGRSTGKSFQLKKEIIEKTLKSEKEKFVYLRRYNEDIDTISVCGYFKDIIQNDDGNNYLSVWSHGQYNNIKAAKRCIWFVKIETVEKVSKDGATYFEDVETDRYLAGYYGSISKAGSYKSQERPDVANYVFEEFIPEGQPLLHNEEKLLESIISSGGRLRRNIRIWLVGNNVDRDFEYFRYFNLNRIKKQKVDTIDVYNIENGDFDEDGNPEFVRFAVEIVADAGKNGILFGRGSKVNSSEWYTKLQPYMHQSSLEDFEEIYCVFFEYHELKWRARLFIEAERNEIFWYIEPFSKSVDDDSRLISDIVDINPLHTISMKPLNKFEDIGFQKMLEGKCFFSSSLCGTEFKRAIQHFYGCDITKDVSDIL